MPVHDVKAPKESVAAAVEQPCLLPGIPHQLEGHAEFINGRVKLRTHTTRQIGYIQHPAHPWLQGREQGSLLAECDLRQHITGRNELIQRLTREGVEATKCMQK